ncbi:MAG TPA: hypothetical protein PLD20_12595 [Blastocatellia bacterium]|nr:hypothetical protein [Blastocatellia bacterium]HMZ18766.1 hypothetical protein [Blastocatellia bacterium]
MYLVLIETSGNQNYIFATNKLRENVGASELTYRAGAQWVLDAVGEEMGQPSLWSDNATERRRNLCDSTINRPIGLGVPIEVITATSGKALLLVEKPEIGQKIIKKVTTSALKKAHGLDICGVISKEVKDEPLDAIMDEVRQKIEQQRTLRPGPAMRFLRLPIIRDCASSGYPAARWHADDENDQEARSIASICKSKNRKSYEERMQTPELEKRDVRLAKNIDEMEKVCEWVAVIHSDGNGLGEIFLKFGLHAGCSDAGSNRDYIKKLRCFSIALDVCAEKAFYAALDEMIKRKFDAWIKLPILPILLGGDDMTIICDGRAALQFTRDYLQAFEEETGKSHELFEKNSPQAKDDLLDIVAEIADAALKDRRISACAGIAIIKPHYPFFAAYKLAVELIESAKDAVKTRVKNNNRRQITWPCSALDFHALYDSTSLELDAIRARLKKDGGQTRLWARPYVVTSSRDLHGATEEGQKWAEKHHWKELEARVAVILKSDENDEGRRALPNSQLHDLRSGLFLGAKGADARYELISHRYEHVSLKAFEEGAGTLFFDDQDSNDWEGQATKLLDAMDAANFWVEKESKTK